jgi:hypothetical protein
MDNSQSVSIFNKKPLSQVILLSFGFAGLLFMAVYFLLGFSAPGFNTLRDTISSLELVKNGWLQQLNFIIYGILLGFFNIGLVKELKSGLNAILIVLFQVFISIGLIGDGIFIHEPLHTMCDLITFNSALIVLFLFAWRFYKGSNWRGWTAYSILTALLMMALLAAFGIANKNHGLSGLYERLVVLPRALWTILFTVRLLKGRSLRLAA